MYISDGKYYRLDGYDCDIIPFSSIMDDSYYYRIRYKDEVSDIYKYWMYSLGKRDGFLPRLVNRVNRYILVRRIKRIKSNDVQ